MNAAPVIMCFISICWLNSIVMKTYLAFVLSYDKKLYNSPYRRLLQCKCLMKRLTAGNI